MSEKDVLSTYEGKEVVLDFVVAANASTVTAMKKLLDAQVSTSAMANAHLRTFLPNKALVAAVHPSGAGTWPGIKTEIIIIIVVSCVVAIALSVGLAWKFLMRKAKIEAQQMHFEVSGDAHNDVDEDLHGIVPHFSIQEMENMNKDIESNLKSHRIGTLVFKNEEQNDVQNEEHNTEVGKKSASLTDM